VQSQRYVSYENGFGYIIPPKISDLGDEAVKKYQQQMDTIQDWYNDWQKQLGNGESANEDARFVLPNACETRLLMTMNVRELRHFFLSENVQSGPMGNSGNGKADARSLF